MNTLKVALLQSQPCGRDLHANLRKGDQVCRAAAGRGAHLALFPEMWSIGYQTFDKERPGDKEAWQSLAERRDGPFVEHFRRLAEELAMGIGITYLEETVSGPRNTITLLDRHGSEVLTYAKVHLCHWDPPDCGCAPGNAFPIAALDTPAGAVQIGAMICFDRELPEAARVLTLNGAEVILTPNACDLDDEKNGIGNVRIAQFRARAFENLVAVAMANYPAPQNDGRSVAYYPDGSLIVMGDAQEAIVMAEIDLARVRRWRQVESGRNTARMPETYGPITERKPSG